MPKKVFVEGSDTLVKEMFEEWDYDITSIAADADLICFTGGADVSPMLYEQVKHHKTINDLDRDQICANLFYTFLHEVPMVGICRGAQFLNVMCGGELYQHINNHNCIGDGHEAYEPETGQIFDVTSDHHQMMIPTDEAEILLVANESTHKLPVKGHFNEPHPDDVEAVLYEKEKCLCYQPHPEWVGKDHECQTLFFAMIETHLK